MTECDNGFCVMAIKPFWRYCVVPEGFPPSMPALPYYTHAGALESARKLAESGSMFRPLLVFRKRRWRWRRIEREPVDRLEPPTTSTRV